MNIEELHNIDKEVSAVPFFKGEGTTIAIHLQKDGELKKHITKTPAMLLCVSGEIVYEDENSKKVELEPGEYVKIEPNVLHWLVAKQDSNLILIK